MLPAPQGPRHAGWKSHRPQGHANPAGLTHGKRPREQKAPSGVRLPGSRTHRFVRPVTRRAFAGCSMCPGAVRQGRAPRLQRRRGGAVFARAGGRPQSPKGLLSGGDEHRLYPVRKGRPQRGSSPGGGESRFTFSLGRFWEQTGWRHGAPWPGVGGADTGQRAEPRHTVTALGTSFLSGARQPDCPKGSPRRSVTVKIQTVADGLRAPQVRGRFLF